MFLLVRLILNSSISLLSRVDQQVVQSVHKAMEVQSEVPDKDMVQAANALMEMGCGHTNGGRGQSWARQRGSLKCTVKVLF